MKPGLRAAYDDGRDVGHQPFTAACFAPFVSLYLDAAGRVSVCGLNRVPPVGDIRRQSLLEIWTGAAIGEVRDALADYDLSKGCYRCAWEIDGGNLHGIQALGFDRFPATRGAGWPQRIEFALTNTCNLQCIMCSGEFSSSIRAHREHLPALVSPYDDRFFAQLPPFLEHLQQARFLGGEPFLTSENFRVWDLMVEVGSPAECDVTTNGTQYNRRVERVLDALPFSMSLSIDGVRPETVERIRAGASFDEIMANLGRFREYTRDRGTVLSLTFCLMIPNWREFGDYLLMAEDLGCQVFVNSVYQPPALSLHRLTKDELAPIVAALEIESVRLRPHLDVNRQVWDDQLGRLRARLGALATNVRAQAHPEDPERRDEWCDRLAEICREPLAEKRLADALTSWFPGSRFWTVTTGLDDRLTSTAPFLDLPGGVAEGEPYRHVIERFALHTGREVTVLAEASAANGTGRIVAFGDATHRSTVVGLFAWTVTAGDGSPGIRRAAAIIEPPAGQQVASPRRAHSR